MLGLSSFQQVYAVAFTTLVEAQEYATQFPEYIQPDNNDWLKPDFSSFHKENKPGAIRRFSSWFGISYPIWDARKFRTLLKSLVISRERDGLQGDFAEQYKPGKGDTFLIWGDIGGAFHSLVRDLAFLHEQGIINKQFKIVKPNYIFIFCGNVIDGSPYALETLTLLLRILSVNHSRVFYLRGHHEEKEQWHNAELARELKIRAQHVSREEIPLNNLLTRFFDTLPLGLYLTHDTQNEIEAVLIANNEEAKSMFSGIKATHLGGDEETRGFFNVAENKAPKKKTVTIKAYITTEDPSESPQKTKGLTLVRAVEGAPHWFIFSSPTERSQKLHQFQYDAFVRMTAHNGISSWTLSLFNQRVAAFDGFQESALYQLVSGCSLKKKDQLAQEEPLMDTAMSDAQELQLSEKKTTKTDEDDADEKNETNFKIATLTDFSKGTKRLGRAVQAGIELRYAQAHAQGETVPDMVFIDDQSIPAITRHEVERLVRTGIHTLLMPTGSATLASYLDLIREGKLLVLFPLTGASSFRDPELTYIIHLRASYTNEAKALTRYAIDTLKSKKLLIFYQDDLVDKSSLDAATKPLKKQGAERAWKTVVYDEDEQKQIDTVGKYAPDTIIFLVTATAAKKLLLQIEIDELQGKKILGCSALSEPGFVDFIRENNFNLMYLSVVPNPSTSDLVIVEQFREAAQKRNMALNPLSLESYIATDLLFSVMGQMKGQPSNTQLIERLEAIKNIKYKGLPLNFVPEDRTLLHSVWLDTGDAQWVELKVS